jgi:hypothetical protein
MDIINNVILGLEGGLLGWALTSYYLKRDRLYVRLVLVIALLISSTAALMGLS